VIIALAGRRIDAPDATTQRFPAENAALVEDRLEELFRVRHAAALIGSAACGVDLIGQRVAAALGLARTIVLPYPPDVFKARSVIDRPGDWGDEFERLLDGARRHGTVIELDAPSERSASQRAYRLTNDAVLDAAIRAAPSPSEVLAVIAWDGNSRGPDDLTAAFAESARVRHLAVEEVSTLR